MCDGLLSEVADSLQRGHLGVWQYCCAVEIEKQYFLFFQFLACVGHSCFLLVFFLYILEVKVLVKVL